MLRHLAFLLPLSLALGCDIPVQTGPRTPTLPPIQWTGPLSDAEALARVVAAEEIRPGNASANARFPTAAELAAFHEQDDWGGVTARANAWRRRVTGNPGRALTTDELIQWAALKWGLDADLLRAVAVVESWWRQDAAGDYTPNPDWCPPEAATRQTAGGQTECAQSYGLMQMKIRYHGPHAWPLQRESTPFVLDYLGAHYRAVWQGEVTWLSSRPAPEPGYPAYPSTRPEDIWGTVGNWYSGSWYSAPALGYIEKVKGRLEERTWEQPDF